MQAEGDSSKDLRVLLSDRWGSEGMAGGEPGVAGQKRGGRAFGSVGKNPL